MPDTSSAFSAASFAAVSKTYDGRSLVIRDLNLEVQKGEFLTLLGSSGSGKTTCLMMLAGFISPTSGAICINGRQVNHIPPHKRNIGVVFQNYALFPNMSVERNVGYPLRIRGVSRSDTRDRVRKVLRVVRMEAFRERVPAQLSGGQKQRVALARAIVFDPELVLMDEPLGALDKQLREHMQIELKRLHDRLGLTVVYVTHDQSEALTMSDRVAVFDRGQIQQIGGVSELYEHPCNSLVAGFVGDNNSLFGKCVMCAGRECSLVLNNGVELTGYCSAEIAPGCDVIAKVRPERIRLAGVLGNASAGMNRIDGKVVSRIYHGDHVRVYFSVDGNPQDVFLKLGLDQGGDRSLEVNASVQVCFDMDHLLVYPAEHAE